MTILHSKIIRGLCTSSWYQALCLSPNITELCDMLKILWNFQEPEEESDLEYFFLGHLFKFSGSYI